MNGSTRRPSRGSVAKSNRPSSRIIPPYPRNKRSAVPALRIAVRHASTNHLVAVVRPALRAVSTRMAMAAKRPASRT